MVLPAGGLRPVSVWAGGRGRGSDPHRPIGPGAPGFPWRNCRSYESRRRPAQPDQYADRRSEHQLRHRRPLRMDRGDLLSLPVQPPDWGRDRADEPLGGAPLHRRRHENHKPHRRG